MMPAPDQTGASPREISLYVHIPYCHYKCRYCSFYSLRGEGPDYDAYLDALAVEWRLVRDEECLDDPAVRVASVYIGGGTPSVLGSERLRRLHRILRDGPAWGEPCEVTLEVNPESVTEELIGGALAAGYNRVNVGAQSFRDDDLALLGRESSGERVRRAIADTRAAGCVNLGIDLVFGLPGMDPEKWRASLREALRFAPEHLSCYLLAPEEETILHQLLHAGRLEPPIDEAAFLQYEAARLAAGQAGYEHYEISNFCKPGFRCRHHLDIWQRRPYYGLGPSAHSYTGDARWCTTADIHDYLARLREGPLRPARQRRRLEAADHRREAILLGLRQARGLTWDEIAAVVEAEATAHVERRARFLAGTGFIEIDEQGLRLAPRAFFVAHHVFVELLEAAEKATAGRGE
ncbi:MAG: radical SAM family heme chaperone HemW [Candidatus Eisenbacteria bacterium]|uniref:Heme chaperone HemW n=1 Tax=Eiseniibacteriota bacterium TaxID=2212470 RepID=A0A938BR53_UNCEI|nr:radical SAM family heme chaperone HemW [Candidatus Eisenbacteria bacterium]